MGLLIASQFLIANHAAAYAVLLLATTCMGLAFGLTVPVINTCSAAFFPKTADRALLTLNTLLGLGTGLRRRFRRPRILVGIARSRCRPLCRTLGFRYAAHHFGRFANR